MIDGCTVNKQYYLAVFFAFMQLLLRVLFNARNTVLMLIITIAIICNQALIARPVARGGGSMGASAPPFLKLEKFKSLPTSAGVFYHSRLACKPKFCSRFQCLRCHF